MATASARQMHSSTPYSRRCCSGPACPWWWGATSTLGQNSFRPCSGSLRSPGGSTRVRWRLPGARRMHRAHVGRTIHRPRA
eukprot:824962-Alexandrium_andersonii.AAC.1